MDEKQLFGLALGLTPPWFIDKVAFDPGQKRLDLFPDFQRGSKFACPECGPGEGCPVHDTTEKTWRHLDFFQHQAFLTARVPRIDCPTHGVRLINVPWARPGSGFTLLFEALALLMCQQMPVAVAAQPPEDDGEPAGGSALVVPPGYPDGEGVPDQADAAAAVELHKPCGSRGVPEAVVLLGDAQPAGTGDRGGEDNQASPGGHPSVRRQPDHDGNRRVVEQQDQDSDETGVRLQILRVPAHRDLPRRRQDQHPFTHSMLKRTAFSGKGK